MSSYWSLAEPANLGEMTQLPRPGRWESQLRGRQVAAVVNETYGLARYGNKLGSRRLLPGVIFEFPTEYAAQYEDLFDTVQGPVLDFYFCIDDNFANLIHMRLDEDRMIPETVNVVFFDGTQQQWLRWIMRGSEEITPVEVQ